MKISSNFSKGKLNKDVDERLVPKGEYTDALNIRVLNTAGGDVGAIENEKGNTKLTFNSESGNPVCIGSACDEANEKIYWFVVNDSGHSFVYEYDVKKERNAVVLSDTRSGANQVLNFNKDFKITGSNVVFNISNNKNLLLFTDGLNPPRSVNIERAKGYGQNNFNEDDINLYKKPPRKAPTVSPYNTPKVDENAVKESFFAFAYRYKYLDGEYSALSAFSNYQFTAGIFDLDPETMENKGMLNVFNAYRIKYNTGDKRVSDIQICFKNPKTGIVYVIDTINKKESGFLDSVEKTFSFSNKKIYKALPDDELNRVFDDVPLTAKAQDFIENRLVFGNIETQYDLLENSTDSGVIKIDYKAEKVSESQEGVEGNTSITASDTKLTLDFTNKDLNKGSVLLIALDLESDQAGSSPNFYFGGSFTGDNAVQLTRSYTTASDFASSDDFIELLTAMNGNFVENVTTTAHPNAATTTYGEFSVDASTSTSITLLAPTIVYKDSGGTETTEQFEFQSDSTYTLRPNTNSLSLKSNRSYEFGIVYLDKYGRYSSVIQPSNNIGSNSAEIFVPVENSIDINTAKITINNKPPYWADRFKFFVKANRDIYYNIYSTIFYEQGLYRWVLLDGNNKSKVEEGMNLIVKADDDGAMNKEVKVKVLEVKTKTKLDEEVKRFAGDDENEGWIEGNVDAGNNPVKELPGVYMKIKPVGFKMDYDPKNFASYENSGHIPWGTKSKGNVNTDLPKEDNLGLAQIKDGSNYDHSTIKPGSRIFFKFDAWEGADADNDDARYFEKAYVSNSTYTGDANESGIEKFLKAETTWRKPSGENYYVDPNDQFHLTFSKTGSGTATRHSVNVKSTEFTRGLERGWIEAEIRIALVSSNLVFESDPQEVDTDIYYETEQTFDIIGGFHVGNTQTQTSSLPAVCDLNIGNCFSFGNGVESIQIRDERLSPFYDLDYRPNIALLDGFKKLNLPHTLIYSQRYNANSSYNSLNEFNASRGIRKNMDNKFGGIQKIFSRESDLIVFQEDRVSKVLFGKALLYGADGSSSLQRIEQVLGQDVPFSGEYGISKNPESFSYYSGRMYFTDASRGVVLRLAGDGITPISYYGLKSYFKNNLFSYKNSYNIGGFDPKYHQYVLSMNQSSFPTIIETFDCNSKISKYFTAASQTYTYNLTSSKAGNVTLAYIAGGTVNISVTINGSTTTHSASGDSGFTIAFTANSTATITLTSVSVGNIDIEHFCPTVATRSVTILVVNDVNDADLSIINRFKVGTNSYYSDEDVFDISEVTRNETISGDVGSQYIPADGDSVTVSSLRQIGYHSGDFNSCNRLGYLVSSSSNLTVSNIVSNATYPTITKTQTTTEEENKITFTFNEGSSNDNLYIVFDYEDAIPTLVNDSVTGLGKGAATTINVLANDTITGTFTVSIHTVPAHGTATVNANNTITYDHDNTATTSDSFTYKVTKDGSCFAIATVSIGIEESPTNPPSTTSITLEYGSVDCATVCSNYGSNPSGTFFMDAGVFGVATKLYTDSAGLNNAPANFYTNGTECRPVDGSGNLGTSTNC